MMDATSDVAVARSPSSLRAALYLRVSTGRQAESDLSIPDQRRQAEAYCRLKGWLVVAADRVASFVEGVGASVTPDTLRRFVQAARRKLQNADGTFRRDYLRALTQRVDVVEGRNIRIRGSKSQLLQALTATAGAETAAIGVRSFIPEWRPLRDSNPCYRRERAVS
jgi:site-specific DNA recombinase